MYIYTRIYVCKCMKDLHHIRRIESNFIIGCNR